ncbi:CD209 antigen-like protein C isoform X3 [Xenopus tropicalis]|uniref:CD209 antigen-like protein C isoform X3 n=1 Tax=Xenopus tropicalis TaxID=8364 RepID=A0A8J1JBF4_XENTR|nr:CD209 antigen-like protein C isoform X3 [Xenopus tropicalis]
MDREKCQRHVDNEYETHENMETIQSAMKNMEVNEEDKEEYNDLKASETLRTQKRFLVVLVILLITAFIFLIILTSLVFIHYSIVTSQLQQADEEKAILVSQIMTINQTLELTCRRCPSGWRMVNSFCYYFDNNQQTWEEANSNCVNTTSVLLILDDDKEMKALVPLIGSEHYWIGMYRVAPGQNKWKWINGRDLHFTSWLQNEPNNLGNENCVEIYNGGWNDRICTAKYSYICKIPQQYC